MAGEIDQLIKQQKYQRVGSYDEIQKDIEAIQSLDKESEKKQTFWFMVAISAIVPVAIGVIALVNSSLPIAIVAFVVAVLVYLFGMLQRYGKGKTNFEDNRYLLLHQVLRSLKTDMPVDATFTVQLDLSSLFAKQKYVRKGTVGLWNVDFFEDPWLQLSGTFKDRTSFVLTVAEHGQKRRRWATSRSGKRKYKSKEKRSTVVQVELKPKATKYPNVDTNPVVMQSLIRIPDWCHLKWVRKTNKGIAAKTVAKFPWEVAPVGKVLKPFQFDGHQMVVLLFMSLYKVLQQSKTPNAG